MAKLDLFEIFFVLSVVCCLLTSVVKYEYGTLLTYVPKAKSPFEKGASLASSKTQNSSLSKTPRAPSSLHYYPTALIPENNPSGIDK